MMFDAIPVVDLASANDPAARRVLAAEIRRACVDVGLFYVTNHGIPDDVITKAVRAAESFFALSVDEKKKLDIHATPNFKGYTALLSANANPHSKGDLHEGFDIGWEPDSAAGGSEIIADGPMSGTNVWPENLPGFQEDVLEYYHAAVRLGLLLFPLFALALDLPEDFFANKITGLASVMRLVHYPPQPPQPLEGIEGIGAHTDYECFTILWQQDDILALQVMNANGKWINAAPIPGTLVLNLGDQFARWTNDVFKPTVHRVINATGKERYSMPLFLGTDYDVKLEPIPDCVTHDNPAKYEVVTAGEYVRSRMEALYAHSAA